MTILLVAVTMLCIAHFKVECYILFPCLQVRMTDLLFKHDRNRLGKGEVQTINKWVCKLTLMNVMLRRHTLS